MKHMTKRLTALFLAGLALFLFSCAKETEEKPRETVLETKETVTLEADPAPLVTTEEETKEEEKEEVETLAEDYFDPLRPDFNLNECRKLAGEITVVVFFLNEGENLWTKEATEEYTELGICRGISYLEEQAANYGIDLHFQLEIFPIMTYQGTVIRAPHTTGLTTVDVLQHCAVNMGLSGDRELVQTLSRQNEDREVICLTVFAGNGTSYAINPARGCDGQFAEHCVLFEKDLTATAEDAPRAQASIAMHELLHLYGAEDYYLDPDRAALAEVHYPTDLMLNVRFDIANNTIGEATAYYVGWLGEAPCVLSDPLW